MIFLAAAAENDHLTHLECCSLQRTLPHLIVVWRQLIEQLLDSKLFTGAVHVGDLLLRQTGEIQLDLRTVKMYMMARGETLDCRTLCYCWLWCGQTLERRQWRRQQQENENLSKIYICKYAAVINPTVWMCFGLKAERPS